MDIQLLNGILLGMVEGLTEFLPISSTGHQIIVGDLLEFNDEKSKVFEVFIQLGAILAICWEYRGRLFQIAWGLGREPTARAFVLNLIIAFLPAALLGLALRGVIKTYLFYPTTVAVALVIGGLIILIIEAFPRIPRIHSVEDLTWKDALKIGCAQSLSLIPGTSRSGATIMGGLLFGLSRQAATEFSFFLAIPTMFAASFYDLFKSLHALAWTDIPLFAAGFSTAFISAFFTIRALLRFVAHHSFAPFGWYRIGFGLLVLTYYS